jgi:hypothetical protein
MVQDAIHISSLITAELKGTSPNFLAVLKLELLEANINISLSTLIFPPNICITILMELAEILTLCRLIFTTYPT